MPKPIDSTPTLLFLCTGNYYRSRFAELYFRHLAGQRAIDWQVDSRGLRLSSNNVGPISPYTMAECRRLGVSLEPLRFPVELTESDLARAALTIAVKETEHRPLIRARFGSWEKRIEFWEIHDLDGATPEQALPLLRQQVEQLFDRIVA